MKLKHGVNPSGVQAQLWWALGVADQLHQHMFGDQVVVTSLNDGDHMPTSKHYKGFGGDLRVKDHAVDAARFFQFLRQRLEPVGFDVLPEGGKEGEVRTKFTNGEHIHVEYDPHPDDRDFFEYCD